MPSSHSSFSGASSFGNASSVIKKLAKYELKRKFYEKLEDFKNRVLLYKEPGFIVYRAKCAYSGGVVVLKGYSRQALTLQTQQRIWCEVNTLQNLHCPFILKCFDSFEDQGWWFLVLENCAAGDLYRIVQAHGRVSNEGWLVSQTLAYLHNEGIIHRDIKPEHVLFNSEKVAKLSGFFLAQDVTKFGYPKDMVGALDYVAPEVLLLSTPEHQELAKTGAVPSTYDFKVDIWMLGVLTYDVLVGIPPFAADSPAECVQRILLDDPVFPDDVTDDAADFILCCLTKDYRDRPAANQLLTHAWVRSHINWQPPEFFDDPVPEVDTDYYEASHRFDWDKKSDDGSDDDSMRDPRVWYNPTTWFKWGSQRRDFDDDVTAGMEAPTGRQNSEAALTTVQKLLGAGQLNLTGHSPPSDSSGHGSGLGVTKRQGSTTAPTVTGRTLSSNRLATLRRIPSNKIGVGVDEGLNGPGTPPQDGLIDHNTPHSDSVSTDDPPPRPVIMPRSEFRSMSSLKRAGQPSHPNAHAHIAERASIDSEAPAPVMQRIQEGAVAAPEFGALRIASPHTRPSAVPPVGISSVHAPTPVPHLAFDASDVAAKMADLSESSTPRTARSGRLEPLQHAAVSPPTSTAPLTAPPMAVMAPQSSVPALSIRSSAVATAEGLSNNDVLKLSARNANQPTTTPATNQPSISKNDLDALAPPGYERSILTPHMSSSSSSTPSSLSTHPSPDPNARLPHPGLAALPPPLSPKPPPPSVGSAPLMASGRVTPVGPLTGIDAPTVISRPASRLMQGQMTTPESIKKLPSGRTASPRPHEGGQGTGEGSAHTVGIP